MLDRISVVIPVFNCDKYITKCINSVLSQQDVDVEVIVVDDGSDDDSLVVCKQLADRDERIIVLQQENMGVSAARNRGICVASGKYLVFVDADDYIPNDAFTTLLDGEAELYIGDVVILNHDKGSTLLSLRRKEESKKSLINSMITHYSTGGLMSGAWGKIFLTSIVMDNNIRFDERFKNGEDGLFVLDYMKHVNHVHCLYGMPPVYYLIRYNPQERTNTVSAVYPDFYRFYVIYMMKVIELMGAVVDECESFYQETINRLIIYLVRAYSYESFFPDGELYNDIVSIINLSFVKEGMKYYRRTNKKNSIAIPFLMRFRMPGLLDKVLRNRAQMNKSPKGNKKVSSVFNLSLSDKITEWKDVFIND